MADETSTTLALVPPVGPNMYNPEAGQDFPIGTPLAQSVNQAEPALVYKARANSDDSTFVVGIAAGIGNTGRRIHTQWAGPLTLTTDQWDAITGDVGGLEVGAPYYLSSATAGKLTKVAPTAEGTFVRQVGIATAPRTLMVQIGPGNGGSSDYAATVAAKSETPGSGRVPFPQDGPAGGAAVRVDGSSFTLAAGVYRVTATVHTTEPGQLELELNGAAVDNSCFGNVNPTSGGHPIIVDAIITVPSSQVLAVINPAGNSTALTITPSGSGGATHAYAQKLIIQKLA